MHIVWGGTQNPDVRDAIVRFVSRQIWGGDKTFGNCVAMGVIDGETLIAGMIFHNYEPTAQTIELSGAAISKRWLNRRVFNEMFSYAFDQAGCQMLVARHSEHNKPLRRMWSAIGAQEYVIPRLRGRNEAEAVATYTAEAWRNGKTMKGLH
jgi:RimJ/RimL family protein N-acetyltransferase